MKDVLLNIHYELVPRFTDHSKTQFSVLKTGFIWGEDFEVMLLYNVTHQECAVCHISQVPQIPVHLPLVESLCLFPWWIKNSSLVTDILLSQITEFNHRPPSQYDVWQKGNKHCTYCQRYQSIHIICKHLTFLLLFEIAWHVIHTNFLQTWLSCQIPFYFHRAMAIHDLSQVTACHNLYVTSVAVTAMAFYKIIYDEYGWPQSCKQKRTWHVLATK